MWLRIVVSGLRLCSEALESRSALRQANAISKLQEFSPRRLFADQIARSNARAVEVSPYIRAALGCTGARKSGRRGLP
jgi:hypothetical protein